MTVAVTDDGAPWNRGTWQVAAGADGRAQAILVDTAPQATVTVGALIAMIGGMPAAPAIPQRPWDGQTGDGTAELAGLLRPDACAYVREDI